jgi:pyridoxine/pyridoxamine 5'-phosphate oxidase
LPTGAEYTVVGVFAPTKGAFFGAWVSQQSAVIEGRGQLETRMKQLEQEYAGQNASASETVGIGEAGI